jgi:Cys-tRNA(Pro)/Cys-tRNA(Cys) deacylase
LLTAKKIPFSTHQLPPEKLSAAEVARILNLPVEIVYKTIVVTRAKPGSAILALVPGPSQVDLKALARILNEKKVQLPTEREAEKLTGLQAGGISALALLHRSYKVVIDQSAESHSKIYISGGQRGLDIGLTPADLLLLTRGIYASISRPAN